VTVNKQTSDEKDGKDGKNHSEKVSFVNINLNQNETDNDNETDFDNKLISKSYSEYQKHSKGNDINAKDIYEVCDANDIKEDNDVNDINDVNDANDVNDISNFNTPFSSSMNIDNTLQSDKDSNYYNLDTSINLKALNEKEIDKIREQSYNIRPSISETKVVDKGKGININSGAVENVPIEENDEELIENTIRNRRKRNTTTKGIFSLKDSLNKINVNVLKDLSSMNKNQISFKKKQTNGS